MSKQVQVHKREPSAEKVAMVERIAKLAKQYPVLAVTRLSKVRSAQLMAVRKVLRGNAEIIVVKNQLAVLGLKRAGLKNADELLKNLYGQNALIFSKQDPFKLFLLLEKNRVNLAARAGDIAPSNIVVPAGNTGQQAGPVLSEFREAGIKTKIEAGSIQVVEDSVVAKPGAVISPKLASLLSRLGIKPIRAGLAIALAYENGLIYGAEAVAIDLDKYRASLLEGFASAKGLVDLHRLCHQGDGSRDNRKGLPRGAGLGSGSGRGDPGERPGDTGQGGGRGQRRAHQGQRERLPVEHSRVPEGHIPAT